MYMNNDYLPSSRAEIDSKSAARLFAIQNNRKKFDDVFKESFRLCWKIEQADSGQYYLKFTIAGQPHSSEGNGGRPS